MAIINNGISPNNLDVSYLISPEQIGILASETLNKNVDSSENYLRTQLDIELKKLDGASILGILLEKLLISNSSVRKKSTPQELIAIPNDPVSLQKFFNLDGERLGFNLQESEEVMNELNGIGIDISSAIEIPSFHKIFSKSGELINEEIVWVSQEERDNSVLENSGKTSSTYPGATEVSYKSGDQVVTKIYFDGQINLRLAENELKTIVPLVSNMYQQTLSDLSDSLKKISDQSENLKAASSTIGNLVKLFNKYSENSVNLIRSELVEIRKLYSELLKEKKIKDITRLTKTGDIPQDFIPSIMHDLSDKKVNPVPDLKEAIFQKFELKNSENKKLNNLKEKKDNSISSPSEKYNQSEEIKLNWKMRALKNISEV